MPRTVKVNGSLGRGKYDADFSWIRREGLADKYVVSGKTPYVLTKSSKKDVINEFPAWIEYITNLDKLLKENMEDNQKSRRIVRDGGKFI